MSYEAAETHEERQTQRMEKIYCKQIKIEQSLEAWGILLRVLSPG